jgi:hypothetical protein
MNPTLRRILVACCSLAFIVTAFIAFANHAMPWPALIVCFGLMGVFMFAWWFLLETPRPTKQCLAIWLITVGLCADLQSMWHALAGHPQPAVPVFALASIATWSGLALELGVILAARRAGQGRDRVTT